MMETLETIYDVIDTQLELTVDEADRLHKLRKKYTAKTFEIAFCGHFSAGKSTLLNRLTESDVLPASPIPTSANVVKISYGPPKMTLKDTSNAIIQSYTDTIPWDEVKKWGKDGQAISSISLQFPLEFLGQSGVIVDTPGVDSTDDTHQSLTLNQLMTTDAVVYVMDYNHVKSETNLQFLKQLSNEGKPLLLVVNQVDKHDNTEVSLEKYRKTAEATFKNWHIHYLHLFFASMVDADHPANEFKLIEKYVKALLYNSTSFTHRSDIRLLKEFLKAVKERQHDEKSAAMKEIEDAIVEAGFEPDIIKENGTVEKHLQDIHQYEQNVFEEFQSDTKRLFNNVNLFPYTTTELMRNWLESKGKGFKKGVIFTRKKTYEEQRKRIDKLILELQDNIKTQLIFHLKTHFNTYDTSQLTNKETFKEKIHHMSFTVTKEWLENQVKEGPVNNEYVYQLTKEVSHHIVKNVKQQAEALVSLYVEGMATEKKREEEDLASKRDDIVTVHHLLLQLTDIENKWEVSLHSLDNILGQLPGDPMFYHDLSHAYQLDYPNTSELPFLTVKKEHHSFTLDDKVISNQYTETTSFHEHEADEAIASWKKPLTNNKKSQLLFNERQQILNRIERYENQTFIISLFGAFSAGKSSFANALLGDNIMPVSPHPTTATVNTVKAPNHQHLHHTAVISFKTEVLLKEDVSSIAKSLGLHVTLASLRKWRAPKTTDMSHWQKNGINYLETVQKALSKSKWALGSVHTVPLEQLEHFTVNEEVACLVDRVDIYYDCKLTRQGIVIVDTPGINSIHARHTKVAFQHMKQSDAIFYLTYYHHAFSKTDRYFLQQMAGINDSFNTNKLYFIINASDLAANDKELTTVTNHVADALKKEGINAPRLFSLSSKEGLKAKRGEGSHSTSFSLFEDTFYKNTILELKALSFRLIADKLSDYKNKVSDTLTVINHDKAAQQKLKEDLKATATIEITRIKATTFNTVMQEIFHELDQFTLFLRQRIVYVLNDLFPEAVNVSILTGPTKKVLQQQLITALQDLILHVENFLNQELEALLLKLEYIVKQRVDSWLEAEVETIKASLPHFYYDSNALSVTMQHSHEQVKLTFPEVENYRSYIKSKKDFFENGDIKIVKESVISEVNERASVIIQQFENLVSSELKIQLPKIEKETKAQLINTIIEEGKRFDAILDSNEQARLNDEFVGLTETKGYLTL
ncbi:dynamin family protein [Salipaludibacillus agaradhaerens]|uniref:Dynamin family protein n=1 Tax=Salipaludibacillus agaradhaerens TaxID=76935 RepID=A0A9Q4B100_SALAG|nr:dynamin family protein [Salipaludibacillus agaradhaerens]MCR6096373.1 dynamin family protein [Salipaludibacillus agaradhaerens]MCR6114068.1 dynamin family protein [Salipaludibacillus agaradhaerens]